MNPLSNLSKSMSVAEKNGHVNLVNNLSGKQKVEETNDKNFCCGIYNT